MTPHATAMLHQPKVPSTGERQATEVQIKWKEVKAQKEVLVKILSETTGRSASKVEQVWVTNKKVEIYGLTFSVGHSATIVYDC